jgi:hypothetical protein
MHPITKKKKKGDGPAGQTLYHSNLQSDRGESLYDNLEEHKQIIPISQITHNVYPIKNDQIKAQTQNNFYNEKSDLSTF